MSTLRESGDIGAGISPNPSAFGLQDLRSVIANYSLNYVNLSIDRPPLQISCWSSSSRWEMWSLCGWLEMRLSRPVSPSSSLLSRILSPEPWPSTESCLETDRWSMFSSFNVCPRTLWAYSVGPYDVLIKLTISIHMSCFVGWDWFMSFRVNHSNNAIVKPPELTPQAAAKELESVMKRVREAQSTIAAAIEPGTPELTTSTYQTVKWHGTEIVLTSAAFASVETKKRSSSRSRRSRRSRSQSRSHSRSRRKRSRSKHRWAAITEPQHLVSEYVCLAWCSVSRF